MPGTRTSRSIRCPVLSIFLFGLFAQWLVARTGSLDAAWGPAFRQQPVVALWRAQATPGYVGDAPSSPTPTASWRRAAATRPTRSSISRSSAACGAGLAGRRPPLALLPPPGEASATTAELLEDRLESVHLLALDCWPLSNMPRSISMRRTSGPAAAAGPACAHHPVHHLAEHARHRIVPKGFAGCGRCGWPIMERACRRSCSAWPGRRGCRGRCS